MMTANASVQTVNTFVKYPLRATEMSAGVYQRGLEKSSRVVTYSIYIVMEWEARNNAQP
jgi:hypothetical protein